MRFKKQIEVRRRACVNERDCPTRNGSTIKNNYIRILCSDERHHSAPMLLSFTVRIRARQGHERNAQDCNLQLFQAPCEVTYLFCWRYTVDGRITDTKIVFQQL